MSDIEIRACDTEELRVETRGRATVIRGLAIVFDKPSENLGGFREVIKAASVDRTLKDGVDLRALVDHDASKVLGRLSVGTLRVEKQARGLVVEIDADNEDPDAISILAKIRRRSVQGMSFAFRTMPNGDEWDFKADPPTRSVTDMLIREVSVVTFPAYPQTEVALRSLGVHRAASGLNVMKLRERLVRQRATWR